MDRLNDLTKELAAALAEADVYKEYIEKRNAITEDDTERIKEFKEARKNAVMQGSSEDDEKSCKLYSELMLKKATREYLLSEKRLLKTINGIYDSIVSDIEIM